MIQKKICLLGSFSVGKTSLAARFMDRPFSGRYLTTIGVRIDRKIVQIGGRDLRLLIWDMAGEDRFQRVEESYLRGAAGYLVVVDGTRRETLEQGLALQERAGAVLGPVPWQLLLNKSDLEAEWDLGTKVLTDLEGRGWRVLKTSARLGSGVEEALTSLAGRLAGE